MAKYYCYYKRDRLFLWLAPIKVEIVHLNPIAVKFIDAISDDEVEAIKALATPRVSPTLQCSTPPFPQEPNWE